MEELSFGVDWLDLEVTKIVCKTIVSQSFGTNDMGLTFS